MVEIGEPQRGDVMVFFPPNDKRYFIKRVIGLPGDVISYQNKTLTINGEVVDQTLIAALPPVRPVEKLAEEQLGDVRHQIRTQPRTYREVMDNFTVTVKPGHYFMMGDNRDNSSDSRVWGQVPDENIVGKAFAVWMHWKDFLSVPSFSTVGVIR